MIREQLFLFPEHNLFIQKEKNIDFIYLDEAKNSHFTEKKLTNLDKKRYILWKTGGINPYMPELGKVFPYLYDNFNKKIKTIRVPQGGQYPICHLSYKLDGKIVDLKPLVHVLVANAFVENPLPEKFKIVHHEDNNPLDYRSSNLLHANQSINITDTKKTKIGTSHDNYVMNFNARVKKK